MILKGNQRGGSLQLANHLLNTTDNDHVQVHSIAGFVADDVRGALMEMYAISKGTKARQFMFSLSLSPPADAEVPIEVYENAIERAAEKLGLAGQPHVVVFHEKANVADVSRRHCHVIFSRINPDKMKAINLPFYKERLCHLSRELFLEQDWDLPKGLADKSLADPLNFGLTEWQEAKRSKRDPREIKSVLKACWMRSDDANAFKAALESKGFWLCRGDRRGFVVLDYAGNVYSLSRWLDVKGKDLQARLGKPEQLRPVDEEQARIASRVSASAKRVLIDMEQKHFTDLYHLLEQRERIKKRQRSERQELEQKQEEQRATEARNQAQRLRSGLRGVWDWITGRRHKVVQQGRAEMARVEQRIAVNRQTLWKVQRDEIWRVHAKMSRLRRNQNQERSEAWRVLGNVTLMTQTQPQAHAVGRESGCPVEHERDFE